MRKNSTYSYDSPLLMLVIGLVAFGTVELYSASSPQTIYGSNTHFLLRHLFWVVLGSGSFIFFSTFNYKKLNNWAFVLIICSIIIVILGYVFSPEGEQSRWLIYTSSGNKITTSDFARFALIIFTASFLDKTKNLGEFKTILPYLTITGFMVVLVAFQRDFSTAGIMAVWIFTILFIAGVKLSQLLTLAGSITPFAILYLVGYQKERISAWINSDKFSTTANWQSGNSQMALGSAGWFGKGIGDSEIKQGLLPQAHTDFIFSVIGEEVGFIVLILILIAFFWLFYRGIKIAKHTPDAFGMYLSIGIVLYIMLYFLINVGYVTGLLPTTGLPMPFFSYGGTNTVITMSILGILLNISRYSNSKLSKHHGRVYA
ncbi:MAG: FtsW/RodA/SpoVE family cell cycle protein [Candidatus Marinimicrobia bacterium]|nr:FtsW/RodA/SpoVE family cell cycle protein [Candidatus Neomarinimicrobiota bacterium]MBL7023283.1 FtsW/RodA/SpoVE family cell cycle protein [Candidatus Neomarinimicrobiota bacterium]MBL7108877.1 FtsW/RodA/SpoVE family cell cycle protein [Candidatus Neomarinimicrobiota bacterium]